MSTIRDIGKEIKKQIREDYLNGVTTLEIQKKYRFNNLRTVYWHLAPLSKKDKDTQERLVKERIKRGKL